MPNVIAKVGRHRQRLGKLLATTHSTVRIASAYVTDTALLLGATGRDLRLLTGWSEMDVVSGATSLKSLQTLIGIDNLQCRVLPALPKLHGKVYIFGEEFALVTSANLTGHGLDKNIEVGVEIRGSEVAKLVSWFDGNWGSERAQKLTRLMISTMKQQTAELRRKFRHLRSLVPPERSPNDAAKGAPIMLSSTASYFLCNTDRRHNFEAEKLMKETNFAVAWETFHYIEHIKRVRHHDIILMYANRVGIIGIGEAQEKCESLPPEKPGRVEDGRTTEWRVAVKWLRWMQSDQACPWRPTSPKTFVDVSSEKYAARRKRVWQHFNAIIT